MIAASYSQSRWAFAIHIIIIALVSKHIAFDDQQFRLRSLSIDSTWRTLLVSQAIPREEAVFGSDFPENVDILYTIKDAFVAIRDIVDRYYGIPATSLLDCAVANQGIAAAQPLDKLPLPVLDINTGPHFVHEVYHLKNRAIDESTWPSALRSTATQHERAKFFRQINFIDILLSFSCRDFIQSGKKKANVFLPDNAGDEDGLRSMQWEVSCKISRVSDLASSQRFELTCPHKTELVGGHEQESSYSLQLLAIIAICLASLHLAISTQKLFLDVFRESKGYSSSLSALDESVEEPLLLSEMEPEVDVGDKRTSSGKSENNAAHALLRSWSFWLVFISDTLLILHFLQVVCHAYKLPFIYFTDAQSDILLGLSVAAACVSVVEHLSFELSQSGSISFIFTHGMPQISRFLVGVFPAFIGSAVFALAVFSDKNRRYGDIPSSFQTLFALMNGDDIYLTISSLSVYALVSELFHSAFIMFFITIVINVCIAILRKSLELSYAAA